MTEAVVTNVHRKLKLSNGLCSTLAQVTLVTTLVVASVCLGSDSTQQYNFFQLKEFLACTDHKVVGGYWTSLLVFQNAVVDLIDVLRHFRSSTFQ